MSVSLVRCTEMCDSGCGIGVVGLCDGREVKELGDLAGLRCRRICEGRWVIRLALLGRRGFGEGLDWVRVA